MPDYRCFFSNCRFSKRILNADIRFMDTHLEEYHFEKIANIALGQSKEFKEMVRVFERKSRVRSFQN